MLRTIVQSDLFIFISSLALMIPLTLCLLALSDKKIKKPDNFNKDSIFRDTLALPTCILISLITGRLIFPEFFNSDNSIKIVFRIAVIVNGAWLLWQIFSLFFKMVYHRYSYSQENNLRQRKIHTQLLFVERVIDIAIVVIATIAITFSFEGWFEIGRSLIASAGLLSVILGLAAQKSIGNLIAGFQIAFTQPIRIDDAVVVENEWGWIEEITLTYVVIRVWDLRRLVVPISYFVSQPFQNWTR